MFFIVYIIEASRYVVVPHTWIMGLRQQMEKFMNYGLNRNQKFTVFYTTSPFACDEEGVPQVEFIPDFYITMPAVFPAEGLYKCYLRACRRE